MTADLGWLEAVLVGRPDRDDVMSAARDLVAADPTARAEAGIMSAQAALNPDVVTLLRAVLELGERLGRGEFDEDQEALVAPVSALVPLAFDAFPAPDAERCLCDLSDRIAAELAARRTGAPVALALLAVRAQAGDVEAAAALEAIRRTKG